MVEFDFRLEKSGIFGPIFRPVARVEFRYGDTVIPEIVYVDSGADITLLSRSIGELLDFPAPIPSEIVEVKGIGTEAVPLVIRKVTVRIGDREFPARVGWCLIEEVPLLLGRLDLFEAFDLIFAKGMKTRFAW